MSETRIPSQPIADSPCEGVLDLIPAYSIGATDPEESEFVRQHLADCPDAQVELDQYAKMMEALHYAPPAFQAPSNASQLQAVIAASNRLSAQQRPTLFSRWRGWTLAAAAAVVILLAGNVYSMVQLSQMHNRQDEIETQMRDQNRALMLLGLGTATRLELTGAQGLAYAAIVWNPKSEYALLYVKDFPPLPADKTYQLWLVRHDHTYSAGTFQVDEEGIGTLFFKTMQPVITADSILVTQESTAGSGQPTYPPVVTYKAQN